VQILEEAAGALPSSDTAIRQAAEWIYDRAFGHLAVPARPEFEHLASDRDLIPRQIANVLHFIHDDKFEVRCNRYRHFFICIELLNHEDFKNCYECPWNYQLE
jgi:hypothetical protein